MAFILAFLAALFFSAPVYANGYVGNAFGVEGQYQIFEFTADGHPIRPVSGGKAVAWPSAVRIGNTVRVYGAELVSGRWQNIRLFSSVSGDSYKDNGVVFSANASEPHGIGPATLSFDGAVYRLYYLIRGVGGPGSQIGLATSGDGKVFARQGVVYSAGFEAAGGLSVSYACTDDNVNYLLVHGYSAGHLTAKSMLASSESADGPFEYVSDTMTPTGANGTISGVSGNAFAQFSGSMTVGLPVVVNDDGAKPYLPTAVHNNTVYLDRPLEKTHTVAPWADFVSNKIDMSFIRKNSDGSWSGAVTGYGSFNGILSEYTAPAKANAVIGPWAIGDGYYLNPYFNSGKLSTENPEPIRTGSSCLE